MDEKCRKKKFELCPRFEKTFSILGKKWNGLIIQVLLEEGSQRFGELATNIPDVSDRVLVERLKELEQQQIITRKVFAENTKRVDYHLTPKGQDLANVMKEIQHWSEKWVKIEDLG